MVPRTLSSTRTPHRRQKPGFHRSADPVPPFWQKGFAQAVAGDSPTLPYELELLHCASRRRWEALPLTREGS